MKLKIRAKELLFFVLAVLLMQIPALDYINPTLGLLNDILRCIGASVVLFFFFRRRKISLSIITGMILLMMGELLVSTVLHRGDLKDWFVAAASVISFGMLFEMTLSKSIRYIKAMMVVMEILTYLHLLLILLFPGGLYAYNGHHEFWLFGQKNLALPYLLIAYVTAFCYGYAGGSKIREYGIYVSGIVSSILVHSSTSTVGLILLVVLFLFIKSGIKFNAYWLLGINLAFYLLIVVFRMQIPILKYFVENVLHKTVTLTGRDAIWDMALFYIRKQPLLGYGFQGNNLNEFSAFGSRWNLYAHNQILQELFDGGIIQLLLYVILILIICRRLNKHRKGMFVQCMIVTLFALNVMFIAEGYRAKILYLVYYFAYYAQNMESLIESSRCKSRLRKDIYFKSNAHWNQQKESKS